MRWNRYAENIILVIHSEPEKRTGSIVGRLFVDNSATQ